jgi:hypothetical protein
MGFGNIYTPTYFIVTAGIFTFLAFFIVTFVLWKNNLPMGLWVLIAFSVLFITLGEVSRSLLNAIEFYNFF